MGPPVKTRVGPPFPPGPYNHAAPTPFPVQFEEQRDKKVISHDLRLLVEVVSRACKAISIAIGKGGLAGVLGSARSDNVQGSVP